MAAKAAQLNAKGTKKAGLAHYGSTGSPRTVVLKNPFNPLARRVGKCIFLPTVAMVGKIPTLPTLRLRKAWLD